MKILGIGMMMLLYDYALTLDDEVSLVWEAKRSFARSLFIVVKYLSIFLLVWTAFCELSNDSYTMR